MHPLVNHLVQLQELTLVKAEQQVHGKDKHLEELDNAIKEMTRELPKETRTLFEKLTKKDRIVIAPVSDRICAACGMTLPTSLIQAVRMGKELQNCPSCARMLYYPESVPKKMNNTPRRWEPRKSGISRFSSHNLMIPELQSTDKEGVIRELSNKMESEGFIDKADELTERALQRESILSTAVDHGLAFPHVRGVEGGITLALGLSKEGVQFDAPGNELTRIIFYIAIPTAANAFYLKLVSGLTETFMKADARKKLLAENDPEKMWKTLCKLTRSTVK
jgi:mannitol/fructose-specific phosphotransferase system IIA component (Ntr-type)/RNase P subunit RPR2